MVFESLVADLLNKYLGDYVENLDKSQLNIGIWGGDVVLKNLDLKATALDDLNLPVKVLSGHLGTLILKIPWKKIYTEPVEVVIEDLFAIAGPNAGLTYDEGKEAQDLLDKKLKKLNRIESMKLAQDAAAKESGSKKGGSSFAEKLATQVVKNLQVSIRNIHIRYEDFHTSPDRPYALGITLDSLSFQTVDEDGNPKIFKETVKKIFKCINLNNLALYWNSNTATYIEGAKPSIYNTMREKIATKARKVKEHQYLIRPINCSVNIELDTKPELSGYSSPKLIMSLVLEEIALQLSKVQYYDIMEMLSSFERMVLADKYRKYRQYLPPNPTRKQMWKYAYTCVLEEDVKRKKKMWSWVNMQRHKELKKLYKEAYRRKLESNKKQSEVYRVLEQCEKELDVFNIVLMRSQAEVAFARAQKEKAKEGGIFSFLRGKKSKPDKKGITDQISELMTDEEYSKLYKAIGYEESSDDPNALPPEYVATKLHFELHSLSLALQDEIEGKDRKILCAEVTNVHADVLQRPSVGNLVVAAKMSSFNVYGLVHDSIKPIIVKSLIQENSYLLSVDFELKPDNKSCDQRVLLSTQAIEIVYDAVTINHAVSFFKPPEHVKLKQLSKAAVSRYKRLKQQSTAGLKDIVQHHKYTEVKASIAASYILLPEAGLYIPGQTNCIVVDLGSLSVESEKDPEAPKKYRAKAAMLKSRRDDETDSQDPLLEQYMQKAYDSFTFQLQQFQVLYAHKGVDWKTCRTLKSSPMHIIQPMHYKILLQKCMIQDPRLANIKIRGALPQVQLTISDEKLLNISSLILSISLPESALSDTDDSDSEETDDLNTDEYADSKNVILEERDEMLAEEDPISLDKSKVVDNATNMTQLSLSFEITEIEVHIAQTVMGKEVPFLKLKLDCIGAEIQVRSFDVVVASYLGGVYLQHLMFKVPNKMLEWMSNHSPLKHEKALENGPIVNLINTPVDSHEEKLLKVSFTMAYSDSPEFKTTYKSTEKTLEVEFSHLEVLLHEQALLTVIAFAKNLGNKVVALSSNTLPVADELSTGRTRHNSHSSNVSDVMEYIGKQATKTAVQLLEPRLIQADIVRFNIVANMKRFECSVCTEELLITHMNIAGFDVGVVVKDKQTEIDAKLTNIEVIDPDPKTLYPKVITIEGSEVFKLKTVLYNKATKGIKRYSSMENVDTRVTLDVNSIRFVFLYRYVRQLIAFVNNFDLEKKQALEMGSKAGEFALDAAQSMHSKAYRLALAITINAPIITVPAHSTSNNAVVAHLGTISVFNSFSLAPDKAKNKDGVPAVLDYMNVSLTDLHMQRTVVEQKDTSVTLAICQILEPVDLKATITRNLASSWYHEAPVADVNCLLPTVKVTCSQGDFSMITSIVFENLGEGMDLEDLQDAPADEEATENTEKVSESSNTVIPMLSLTPAEKIYVDINVAFSMDILEAILYLGESDLTSTMVGEGKPMVQRKPSQALARFSLSRLDGSFIRKNDNSMEAAVSLNSLSLDDIRPSCSQGITKMIERVDSDSLPDDPMIELVFKQFPDLRKTVDVYLNKLFIIVAVPYLMAISNFFKEGMPKVTNKEKAVVKKQKDVVSEDLTNETLTAAEIFVKLHVKHPEIILVEDTSVKNTNALILDTGITFEMRLSSQATNLKANVDLQVISAMYDVIEKKYEKISQIITPCNITMNGSAPENSGIHIAMSLTEIDVCVSPATISSISKIASNLKASTGAGDDDLAVVSNLWVINNTADMDMWYLNTESTKQDDLAVARNKAAAERGEQILITAPRILFKLEGGAGNKTVPLLVAELDMQAEVKDWSSKLYMDCTLGLAVSYFNEKCSVWEPFLEPVNYGKKTAPWTLTAEQRPFHLLFKLVQNEDYYTDVEDDESDSDVIGLQPPKMSLHLFSEDPVDICLSKAGLEMLTALSKAFGDAYKLVQPSAKAGELHAPYTVRNDTGTLVAVTIDKNLEVMSSDWKSHEGVVTLEKDSQVSLQSKRQMPRSVSILKQAQEGQELDFVINMLEYEASRDVLIQRAIKRCFHVFKLNEAHALVIETSADLGRRLITLRSDTEVVNTLSMAITIYYADTSNELQELTTLNPGAKYNLPLSVVYGKHQTLFFKPKDVENVEVSAAGVKWKSLSKDGISQLVSCSLQSKSYTFNIMVETSIEQVYTEDTDEKKSKCIIVTLKPPIVLFNQLPYAISIKLHSQDEVFSLDQGQAMPLHTCSTNQQIAKLTLHDYLHSDWVFEGAIGAPVNDYKSVSFYRTGSTSKKTDVRMLCKLDGSCHILTLHSSYWFINRTSLDLFYRDMSTKDEELLPHRADYSRPYLFCYRNLHSAKEKASMKIGDSKWSDKFSLDTVGSMGTINCKAEDLTYQVGVKITLGGNGLTKIVECSPYYVLVNNSNTDVTFTEQCSGGSTITVSPEQCLPFWPKSSKDRRMVVGVLDSNGCLSTSESFLYNSIHCTLLRLNVQEQEVSQKCAVHVEVTKSDLAVVISIDDYKKGMEAARIVNCMPELLLTYHQVGSTRVSCLGPGESCLYTWDNPLDKRVLLWSSGQEADKKDELMKDGIGEFFADKGSNHKLFWVSFLDGMQRVLLFTEDIYQATRAQEAGEFERIELEVVLSLEGAGLSMVDNEKRQEIAYFGVTSSGVVWEEKKKRHWKAFNHQVCEQLEEAYQRHQKLQMAGKPGDPLFTTGRLEVDLTYMRQVKPYKRAIRRIFQPGIWFQYKTSVHQTHLHAKINRVQLDNQLVGAVYPVVFSPTPLPKSVAAESVPKAFIETSLVMRKHEHSEVQQIKYLKVLIQEMTVKADQGFINALISFFGEGKQTPDQLTKEFEVDLANVSKSLLELSEGTANKGHKNFYDMLHFSPLKIHLSFSVTGGKTDDKAAFQSEVLQLFLQSIGVVITDVQDVLFRIAYFERNFVFYEHKTLIKQIRTHYTQQAIKQAYVLVLGLDVLGNPFGLIEGLADGAKGLFYEPIQGAIQGPEEFAEGLALGIRNLLSGTVGGAAGAVSRITGTIGKGLAAITLDDKYQQKRRENMNKQPANLQEGFTRGVKGLGMGFFDGVTGIVRKPVEGAKEQGVEGFFKGIGKGLIGVVARPTGGVVDFASSSFEGLRKFTTLSREVTRLRPPRNIRKDGVITPYNFRLASGTHLLQEVSQGKYAHTDQFIVHCQVTADGNNFLIATDKRVLFIKKSDILMNWDVEWTYEWVNLVEPPVVTEGNKIRFMAKAEEKKKFSLFGGKTSPGKLVTIPDHRQAEWMTMLMVEAYQRAK